MLNNYYRYRAYEMLPGIIVWTILIGSVLLTFFKPLWAIYLIILFDIYWVLRVLNYSFYLILSWLRFQKVKKIDWKGELENSSLAWQSKKHVIFLTLYKEEWGVVQTAIASIAKAVYTKEQFVLVIAGEGRVQEHVAAITEKIQKNYADVFADIVSVIHPDGLADEIPGKGSNLHYSEQYMKEYIDAKQWDYAEVIATIFDIDTICDPQYFSYLTFLYCSSPNPTRTSFQPIALFNNNIWESPAILRIMSFGTTFWILMGAARQDVLVTFSSHSMSWKALVDVGFHDKRIVSEDSRIFYQCLLQYNGEYTVTPMYVAVSMDTVRDDKWWKSIKNLYKQQRRWAWGVEHVPYLIWEFRKKGNAMPLYKKLKWIFVELEGKVSWCCVAILITILGWLPMYTASEEVRQSALFLNTPHVLSTLMTAALLGLFLSAFFSMFLLPKKPDNKGRYTYVFMLFQWALMPFTMIAVSAIPAIDAVTHLLFGKYLGFNVSQKKRK